MRKPTKPLAVWSQARDAEGHGAGCGFARMTQTELDDYRANNPERDVRVIDRGTAMASTPVSEGGED